MSDGFSRQDEYFLRMVSAETNIAVNKDMLIEYLRGKSENYGVPGFLMPRGIRIYSPLNFAYHLRTGDTYAWQAFLIHLLKNPQLITFFHDFIGLAPADAQITFAYSEFQPSS